MDISYNSITNDTPNEAYNDSYIVDNPSDILSYYAHQKTLKNPIYCSGIGVHTGMPVSMVIEPKEPDYGLYFMRNDIAGDHAYIKAHYSNVSNTTLCTQLSNDAGITINTTEHLLSAMYSYGITNALIKIDGPELPIMDGSAAIFAKLIDEAGIDEQLVYRPILRVDKPVIVEQNGSIGQLVPYDYFALDQEIDYSGTLIGIQRFTTAMSHALFNDHIAMARTFGFAAQIDTMREQGLALGGSLNNSILVSDDGILNDEGLRAEREFIRHKVLDAIGDFALSGYYVKGLYIAHKGGHWLTNKVLHALFNQQDYTIL